MPEPGEVSTWYRSRRLFVSSVASVFALAFVELGLQVQGLFGSRGIAPVADLLDRIAPSYSGWDRLQVPSLLWFGASDAMLGFLCIAGAVLAALALVGILPRLLLLLCWALYLSFARVGQPFLNFQWDALLLEAGLLAAVWAPGGVRPYGRSERAPSDVGRWLVHWLLFRLMLLSGLLKLASGDPSWRDGTALDFHYWTQPLPHVSSHYAHGWPGHAVSVWVMFAIELGVPLLLVVPYARRRCRQAAAAATVALMVAIFATGNYGFFNLLTVVLCVPLLDDRALGALLRRPAVARPAEEPAPRWRRVALGAFAVVAIAATTDRALTSFGPDDELPWPARVLHAIAAPAADLTGPFESFNSYGLFRVMTKERPELLVEGSDDGVAWRSYGFRYKPLEPDRPPVFAGLWMPRLDWQLWFAALGHRLSEHSAWTLGLLQRLLEGSPAVLDLLGTNPFPDRPPQQVRIRIAPYEFSTPDERRAGIWWRRGEFEPYSGAWTLSGGRIVRAR